jgi:hypothetical protein
VRSSHHVGEEHFTQLHAFVVSCMGLATGSLLSMPGWCWQQEGNLYSAWDLPVRAWRSLTIPPTAFTNLLNRRWSQTWSPARWQLFWQNLWNGISHLRTKFLIWRVMQFGFYTNVRGALWGVSTELCPQCQKQAESTLHLFFKCPEVNLRWSKCADLLKGTTLGGVSSHMQCTYTSKVQGGSW